MPNARLSEKSIEELEKYIEDNMTNDYRCSAASAILTSKINRQLVMATWLLAIITCILAIITLVVGVIFH